MDQYAWATDLQICQGAFITSLFVSVHAVAVRDVISM